MNTISLIWQGWTWIFWFANAFVQRGHEPLGTDAGGAFDDVDVATTAIWINRHVLEINIDAPTSSS